jgi:hypothetical protein
MIDNQSRSPSLDFILHTIPPLYIVLSDSVLLNLMEIDPENHLDVCQNSFMCLTCARAVTVIPVMIPMIMISMVMIPMIMISMVMMSMKMVMIWKAVMIWKVVMIRMNQAHL